MSRTIGHFRHIERGRAGLGEVESSRGKKSYAFTGRGAFHSPLMEPARRELAAAIEQTAFQTPVCPVYQNVNALPTMDVSAIKNNLIAQLTAPVRWTQSVQNMVADGARVFIECGPGKVLQGLVKRLHPKQRF